MERIVLIEAHNGEIQYEFFDTLKEARANMKLRMLNAGVGECFFTPNALSRHTIDYSIYFDFFRAGYKKSENDNYGWKIISL